MSIVKLTTTIFQGTSYQIHFSCLVSGSSRVKKSSLSHFSFISGHFLSGWRRPGEITTGTLLLRCLRLHTAAAAAAGPQLTLHSTGRPGSDGEYSEKAEEAISLLKAATTTFTHSTGLQTSCLHLKLMNTLVLKNIHLSYGWLVLHSHRKTSLTCLAQAMSLRRVHIIV